MATAIEYGLIGSLIAVAVIGGVTKLNQPKETERPAQTKQVHLTIDLKPDQKGDIGFDHHASPRLTLGTEGEPVIVCPVMYKIELLGHRDARCVPG